jgi:hypothetical protein
MMNLLQTLLEKARKDELAHFYILETSAPQDIAHETLLKFVHEFIRDYFQQIEGQKQNLTHLMDHPDVFVLGNISDQDESSEKAFKVDEAETLGRFFEFRPIQGKKKFAVISEAHRISVTVANKWLKLFEEPYGNSTIFLLNPRGGQLLPTIHSRAIHLRLPNNEVQTRDTSHWYEFVGDLNKMSFYEFLEAYRDQNISFWVNELIFWESEQIDHYHSKDKLSLWLKTFQEMEIFHQPTATKWSLFHSFLKEHVSPRLK